MGKSKRKITKNVSEDEEYEVERVASHRIVQSDNGPQLQYYLKWKNFPDKDNTWEPSDAVSAGVLISKYWSSQGKGKRDQVMKKLQPVTHKRKAGKEISRSIKKAREDNKDSDLDISDSEIENESFRKKVSWKDALKVDAVRLGDDKKTLEALVRWSDGRVARYPSSFVGKKIPSKLIEYYEKRLLFEKARSVLKNSLLEKKI